MDRRRNPFEDLERMLDRMNEHVGGDLGERSVAVDVEDRPDSVVVTADLPGYDRDAIEVTARDDRLSISAAREERHEQTEGEFVQRERHSERVSRTVSLPAAVDEDAASASYSNGVLTVTLPKAGDDDGQRIDIE